MEGRGRREEYLDNTVIRAHLTEIGKGEDVDKDTTCTCNNPP